MTIGDSPYAYQQGIGCSTSGGEMAYFSATTSSLSFNNSAQTMGGIIPFYVFAYKNNYYGGVLRAAHDYAHGRDVLMSLVVDDGEDEADVVIELTEVTIQFSRDGQELDVDFGALVELIESGNAESIYPFLDACFALIPKNSVQQNTGYREALVNAQMMAQANSIVQQQARLAQNMMQTKEELLWKSWNSNTSIVGGVGGVLGSATSGGVQPFSATTAVVRKGEGGGVQSKHVMKRLFDQLVRSGK